MASKPYPSLPSVSPDHRRVAAETYLRAQEVIKSGNHDYAIQLLFTCCKLDPANLSFRQTLRRVQKDKFKNNMTGSKLAFLSAPRYKTKMKASKAAGDYLTVLEVGEILLSKNPWDLGTQTDMADAFDALGLTDLAVFTLDQARQKYPKEPALNRAMARLLEKRGDFQKAILLWQLVKEAAPADVEAAHKAKDLAASETIARGNYEESVSGSKSSPVLDLLDKQNADRGDRLGREAAPLLKRIEADPTEPSLYVQLAAVYRKGKQDDRARAVLQQGLGPTGNHPALQLDLLELDIEPVRKNLELTDNRLRSLRKKKVEVEDEETTEDDLLRLRSKLQKEILNRELEIYRTKAERFPSDLSHRLELGTRLLKAEKFDEAIVELQQARRDEKLKGRAAMHLGLAFRLRQNPRLAQRNFEEALTALPASDETSRKECLFQLATGAAEAGDYTRAMDLGHELANLDFGFRGIGGLIDEWQELATAQ